MPSRNPHTKSHHGCVQCKSRKVKVSQHTPLACIHLSLQLHDVSLLYSLKTDQLRSVEKSVQSAQDVMRQSVIAVSLLIMVLV